MLRAHFNWKLMIFVVLCLPVLLRLGFWQLDRAEQKRTILAEQQTLAEQPAVDYQQLDAGQFANYRNVSVQARWLPRIFLLDNQTWQGKFGYEVIQAAQLENGQLLLVSRGWIQGSLDRKQLPQVDTPAGIQLLSGYLYQPQATLQLAETETSTGWPRVIQAVELEKLYKQVGITGRMPPLFLLRLDQYNPAVLTSHWQIVNVLPEKHTGYAVQWFLMAAVLVILFLVASFRRIRANEKA